MTLEELLKREAPEDNEHDRAYAKEIKRAWNCYEWTGIEDLENNLKFIRASYNGGHSSTASCVVIYALIENKKAVA